MTELITTIWTAVVTGNSPLVAFLFATVLYLLWERHNTEKQVSEMHAKVYNAKDHYIESLEHVIDKYYTSNSEITGIIKELKTVLSTMQKSL